MFRADFRRVWMSPVFYVCILIMEICALSSAWYEMEFTNDLLFLATKGWQSGNAMVAIAIPLLSGMAFAGGYCEERQSGYHYIAMVRGSRLRYCVSKVCVAAMSGFLMVLAAGVLFPVVCMILKRGDLVLMGEESRMVFANQWEAVFLEKGCPVLAWLSWLLTYCVAASIWPALALCVSLFVRNRYVVMVSPFVAEQLFGTLVVGMHQPWLSYTALLPGHLEGAYSGWGIRLGVVIVICLAELVVFTWGVMRETR